MFHFGALPNCEPPRGRACMRLSSLSNDSMNCETVTINNVTAAATAAFGGSLLSVWEWLAFSECKDSIANSDLLSAV